MNTKIKLMWKVIVKCGIATDEELGLITTIIGCSEDTLNKVVYARTGYSDIIQFVKDYLRKKGLEI